MLKRLSGWRDRRRAAGDQGVSLVIVALSMVAILGIAALVVDLGNARQMRRELQGGTDAAALAAAQDLPAKTDAAATRYTKQITARNNALKYAVNNLVGKSATPNVTCTVAVTCTDAVGGVSFTVSTPWNPGAGTVAGVDDLNYIGYVYVQACESTPTFFAGVLQQKAPKVCRSAVGRFITSTTKGDYGLVATDPHSCPGLTFAGNSDTILTSNGAVMINSDCNSGSTQALDSNGSSWQLQFVDTAGNKVPGYIGVVGGATLAPCDPVTQTTKCTVTSPTTGITAFGDPLGGLVTPTKPSPPAQTCSNNGGVIDPGLYSGCKVTTGNLDIHPGIYYITGDLSFQGGDIRCVDNGATTCANTGVLFYVEGSIKLNGNGKVYLPPYTSTCTPKYTGTCYDGLSIWQVGTSEGSINGTNDFNLGTVYVKNANLKTNGNGGGAQVNITGLVVAKTVDISGTFDFNIKVPGTSPDVPSDPTLGLEK